MAMDDLFIPAAGIVLVGYTLISGGGENASRLAETGNQVKEIRQEQAKEAVLLQTKAEGLQGRADVAKARYESGCTFHYELAPNQSDQVKATGALEITPRPIQEGAMPIDWQGRTYSNGQTVCDIYGNTGVVNDQGRVMDHAFNGQIDTRPFAEAYLSRIGGKS